MPKVSLTAEIFLEIKSSRTESLRQQLESGLRVAIDSKRIPANTALPSTRLLAEQLGISRGLVVSAYEQLISEGYLIAASGSATRVAGRERTSGRPLHVDEPSFLLTSQYNFTASIPDISYFPKKAWLAATRDAINSAPFASLSYSHPQGDVNVRDALSKYLNRVRATSTNAADVVMCTGATQGIRLICQALRLKGIRRVAVEIPGYLRQAQIIKSEGLATIPIAVDSEGIRVPDLWASDAEVAFVTPACQFPTGYSLTLKRRNELIAWAKERQALIVEDDYGAEYRYEHPPISALQGLAPDVVIYIGTSSQILAPGIRLAWLLTPPSLVSLVSNAKLNADQGSPVIDQLVLATFIERGGLDGHLRKMRAIYKKRRGVLIAALSKHLPNFSCLRAAAGLHVMVEMPLEYDERRVIDLAQKNGIEIDSAYAHSTKPETALPALNFGFGCIEEPIIEEAIKQLARLIETEYISLQRT